MVSEGLLRRMVSGEYSQLTTHNSQKIDVKYGKYQSY